MIYGVLWYAAALNALLLAAILASGMIFAVEHLVEVVAIILVCSLVVWGYLALILLPVWVISRLIGFRLDPPEDPLHDAWLDGSGGAPFAEMEPDPWDEESA
jgi:hypothetical protein